MTDLTTTTFTIDCQSCPARGRLCGDCFVPVLGRSWLEDPRPVAATPEPSRSPRGEREREDGQQHTGDAEADGWARLDSDELAAVGAFVRAGLVDPAEADRARAQLSGARRYAAG